MGYYENIKSKIIEREETKVNGTENIFNKIMEEIFF